MKYDNDDKVNTAHCIMFFLYISFYLSIQFTYHNKYKRNLYSKLFNRIDRIV